MTVGKALAIVAFIFAALALVGVAASAPLLPLAVLLVAAAVVVG